METLSSAPNLDAGQENEEGGPNHVLIISDCNGRCEFVSVRRQRRQRRQRARLKSIAHSSGYWQFVRVAFVI